MKKSNLGRVRPFTTAAVALLFLIALASGAAAQQRRLPDLGRIGGKLVDIRVGEVTLEAINFRDQTASLNVRLDVSTPFMPVSLSDFDYRLRLNGGDLLEGRHDGTMRIGGRKGSRLNLPVTVNLRSIPGVVWSAFSNRGRVSYELDTAFTVPLYVTERRFDQSFSGEVPLRTLVDAASILRARQLGEGRRSVWGF